MVGVATQSSKGLRVTTQCRDVDQFVRAFHRYCESSSVFISHARRSVGEVIAFSFDLADGSPALSGLGAVIEQFATADNRFGRPGIVIALHRLTRASKRVFAELSAARMSAPEPVRRDETPLSSARGVTSILQMIDPETLTPVPQPPPHRRTATRPIAVIATSPPARRTPPSMNIPAIVMPSSPVAENKAPPALAEGTEVAHAVAAPPQSEPAVEAAAAVIDQPDAMAEQTARMASPPYVDLVPRTPDAAIIASADAYESGHSEVAPLPPPPDPVQAPTTRPEPIEQTWTPAMVTVAAAQPAAMPVAAAMPTPSPRWTKRRMWAVATFGGASLLALGIVIGATVFGGGTRGASQSPPSVSTVSPLPAAPAPAPAAPAPTPVTPAPTLATTAPIAATPEPAALPAHTTAKPHVRPKTPVKKPPARVTRHKHASSKACTSLTCL